MNKKFFTGHKKPEISSQIFQCRGCESNILQRARGFSLVIVCEKCQSRTDLVNNRCKVIQGGLSKKKFDPVLKLGSTAILDIEAKKWEVIGFVVRCDSSTVYQWHEYLLFNPFKGFRWLVLNKGHWCLFKQITKKFKVDSEISYAQKTFKKYLVDKATIVYACGEFYWHIRIGEKFSTVDYISPPFMLSWEKDKKINIWTLGSYIDSFEIKKAFNIGPDDFFPLKEGVAPNQPSIYNKRIKIQAPIMLVSLLVVYIVNGKTSSYEASNFLLTALFIIAPPMHTLWKRYQTEIRRWEHSDFAEENHQEFLEPIY